ncbi:MAG: hypothetical protein QM668_15860 [Agriterribacter sp.]
MKRLHTYFLLLSISCCCVLSVNAYAQSAKKTFSASMQSREDSMKQYAFSIVNAASPVDRFNADSIFTKMLVRALKEPHSFYYPFDSLQTISRLYAPDSSFRIFTWQVVKDESVFRRHGAIQMNTANGELVLFPLIDKTSAIENINNAALGNDNWVGAIYYKILLNTYNGQKYYTLLGYDENSFKSTKKRIEVLTFNQNGKPVFGGAPFFNLTKNGAPAPPQARFSIEYKKDANALMRYDNELNLILFDHLIPENNEPEKKYTYVPDGDYEAFKWQNGRWIHVDKVFDFKLQDGQAPVEKPVKENKLDIRKASQ